MKVNSSRRDFGKAAFATAAWSAAAARPTAIVFAQEANSKPAVLGGAPIRTQSFPSWPIYGGLDRDGLTEVLDSGKWCRLEGHYANDFEQKWAEYTQAKHCLATASGTTALLTALNALGVGPGDEVIVPPYTFVATINVVMLQFALPVFVDTDRETFEIDADKVEAAITPRTRAILPVHLGGSAANMDKILAIGKTHNLPVLEDACQAHLGEWRGKKLGTVGTAGCFSFQASKNLNSGEGGAIMTDDDRLMEFCRSFHNNGRGQGNGSFSYVRNGSNHRITEFQAGLLLKQLTRLEAQTRTRTGNAQYLTSQLQQIDGISPAKMYDGCTRNSYLLYMFRYDAERFQGLSRDQFIKAFDAEGIPSSSGYGPLNKEPFIRNIGNLRSYKRCFDGKDLTGYPARIHCPENDRLCTEAVWFPQTMLLGPRSDMDQIVAAIQKIQKNAAAIAKHLTT